MARYSLFVLKMPLNPKQTNKQGRNKQTYKAVSPCVKIPLLSVTCDQCDAIPAVSFPARAGTKLILLGDRGTCVWTARRPGFEPATYLSPVQHCDHLATELHARNVATLILITYGSLVVLRSGIGRLLVLESSQVLVLATRYFFSRGFFFRFAVRKADMGQLHWENFN